MSEVFLRPTPDGQPDRPARPDGSAGTAGSEGRAPRDRKAMLRTVAVVLGAYVVLGLVAGLVWWLVTPSAEFVKLPDGSGSMSDVGLGRQFDAVGSYVVVALVAGLLSGLVLLGVTIWRRLDELVVVPAMLVGSGIAALVSDYVGRFLGPGDPVDALKGAAAGARIPDALAVHAHTAYLAWPVAVLLGGLLVLLGPEHAEQPPAGRPQPDHPQPGHPQATPPA